MEELSIASTGPRTSTVSFDSGTLPLPSVSTEPRFSLPKRTANCFDAFVLVEFDRAAIVKRSLQLRPFVAVFFRSPDCFYIDRFGSRKSAGTSA